MERINTQDGFHNNEIRLVTTTVRAVLRFGKVIADHDIESGDIELEDGYMMEIPQQTLKYNGEPTVLMYKAFLDTPSRSLESILEEEFLVNTQNFPKEYHKLFREKFNRAKAEYLRQFEKDNSPSKDA